MLNNVIDNYINDERPMEGEEWQHWPHFIRSIGEALSSNLPSVPSSRKMASINLKMLLEKHLAQNDIDSACAAAIQLFFAADEQACFKSAQKSCATVNPLYPIFTGPQAWLSARAQTYISLPTLSEGFTTE